MNWPQQRSRTNAAIPELTPILWATLEDLTCPVVLLSDFYLSSPDLTRIIAAAAGRPVPWPVVVSVDEGCSKRLHGQLFRALRTKFGVAARDHLHIGDNPISDVAAQQSTGVSAVAVASSHDFPAPGSFEA